jgi:hypothetical protein
MTATVSTSDAVTTPAVRAPAAFCLTPNKRAMRAAIGLPLTAIANVGRPRQSSIVASARA